MVAMNVTGNAPQLEYIDQPLLHTKCCVRFVKFKNGRPFPTRNDIGVRIPATTKDGPEGLWRQGQEKCCVPWWVD